MNPSQVKTWDFVEAWLWRMGFAPTHEVIDGGRYWVSKSKRHIIVPDHVDGFYPDEFWRDLERRVGQIVP